MSKNTHFNRYPPFIHGEARGEDDEFILHTRYPRFLAKKTYDDNFTGELPTTAIKGGFSRDDKERLYYNSGAGVWFSNFIFFDSQPTDKEAFAIALLSACDRGTADSLALDDDTETIMIESGLGDML